MAESGALDGYAVAELVAKNVRADDPIKFKSPAAVSNFCGSSATILSAPSLVSVVVVDSATSNIVHNILNAYASAAFILRNSSSVASTTISTTPWMIQLTAPASDSINFNSYGTIPNLLIASASVLSAPSLILRDPYLVFSGMGTSVTYAIFMAS